MFSCGPLIALLIEIPWDIHHDPLVTSIPPTQSLVMLSLVSCRNEGCRLALRHETAVTELFFFICTWLDCPLIFFFLCARCISEHYIIHVAHISQLSGHMNETVNPGGRGWGGLGGGGAVGGIALTDLLHPNDWVVIYFLVTFFPQSVSHVLYTCAYFFSSYLLSCKLSGCFCTSLPRRSKVAFCIIWRNMLRK